MNAIASSLINGLLSVKPLATFAKNKARNMMMDRAESLGIYWRDEAKALRARVGFVPGLASASGQSIQDEVHPIWEEELKAIANLNLTYPAYYTTSFHAYDEGNLGWLPATEVDVAARSVHARIWPVGDERAGLAGDASLRQSYHQVLKATLPAAPHNIVDLGAGVGLSTTTLQAAFPTAQLIGVDLSPYFLAVAQHVEAQQMTASSTESRVVETQITQAQITETPTAENQRMNKSSIQPIQWLHAAAENTGLPDNSADLVSACLVFHELPTTAAEEILAEAYRLVRPGGYFSIMDMNPQSEVYRKMPPYILTLLKSTEPYLDQYFALDISKAFQAAGFSTPTITCNTPRHRTIIGQKL